MQNSSENKNSTFKKIFNIPRRAWKWYARQFKGRWYQRVTAFICSFIMLIFVYLGAVDINLFGLFGKSPTMECIENPISNEASLVYSADSVLIGKFFSENRSPVTYDEISPYMLQALVTTEDERFYKHHGIDFQGLFAAVKDMAQGHARGASTITQQLVKNLFKVRSQYSTGLLGQIPGLRILIMKSKEWINAIKIEQRYSKEDILTLYLNTVDFGSNAYGIKTAARTYFNTTPDQLKIEEAATLVGLLKATTTYNPKVHPDKSLERRNVVIDNMYSHGLISREERDSIKKLPIELHYSVENSYDGQAQYFRQAIRAYLQDWCEKNDINLYSDGLRIYTTIDSRMQKYAEEAAWKQMKVIQNNFDNHWRGRNPWCDERGNEIPGFIEELAKHSQFYKILAERFPDNKDSIDYYMNLPHKVKLFSYDSPNHTIEREISTMDSIRYMVGMMHCGFVAMEPQTSYVKAWVGDVDFKAWKYDKVTAKRQPGSTFKLFVYAAAFEKLGLTPVDRRQDSYISLEVPDNEKGGTKIWTPHNANGYCTNANVPLKAAFAQSINTIAVKLGQEAGIGNVIDVAHAMGVHSPLDNAPSLALGASDVSLLELVDGYCTAMNDGMQRDPILVTQIKDRDGNVIYDCEEEIPEAKRAISYKTAFYLQQLMKGGMREPGGTSQALWGYKIHTYNTEFGGKTGTSSNHSDAWFVGATPYLVGGGWVGGEYRCIHFRTGMLGQGSRTALPIFGYFMEKVMANPAFKCYRGKFSEPKEDIPQNTYIGPSFYAPKNEEDTDSLGTDDAVDIDMNETDELVSPEENEQIQ